MDKFEERYRLGEIHRRRMGKKWSWWHSDTSKDKDEIIDIDTAIQSLNNIHTITELEQLLALIMDFCKDDTLKKWVNNILSDVFWIGESESLMNTEIVTKIFEFIVKNKNDCEKLRRLCSSMLSRVIEIHLKNENIREMMNNEFETKRYF